MRRAKSIVRDEMFDKALALATRRGENGDAEAADMAKWWRGFAGAGAAKREEMVRETGEKPRRGKKRKKNGGDSEPAAAR